MVKRHDAIFVRTATDVLRVARVLMGGNAELVGTDALRFARRAGCVAQCSKRSIGCRLEQVVEDMCATRGLWKRVGERLHPFELADKLPNAALAFAVVRGTRSRRRRAFGAALRERGRAGFRASGRGRSRQARSRGPVPIEDALRAGNPRSALARLTHRPGELLRRADHLVRVAQARQPEALQTILKAVELAATQGRACDDARRSRVTCRAARSARGRGACSFPKGEVLRAWGAPDERDAAARRRDRGRSSARCAASCSRAPRRAANSRAP